MAALKEPKDRHAPTVRPMDAPTPPFPGQHQPAPRLEAELAPAPKYEADRYRPARMLRDQIALITGGDSGIGRAVALIYARASADVAINYLPQEQTDAEATRDAVERTRCRCLLLPGDLTDPDFCTELAERTSAASCSR